MYLSNPFDLLPVTWKQMNEGKQDTTETLTEASFNGYDNYFFRKENMILSVRPSSMTVKWEMEFSRQSKVSDAKGNTTQSNATPHSNCDLYNDIVQLSNRVQQSFELEFVPFTSKRKVE